MSIHLGTALPEQVCDPINEPEQESPRQPQQKECPIATEITHRLQIPAVIGRNGSVDVGGVSLSCDNFCHESLCCVLCSYVASLRSSVTDRSSRTSVYFITDESTNTRLRRWMNPQLSDDKSTETDHLIIGVTSKANAFQTVLCDSQGFSFWDRNTSEEIQLGTLRLFKCQIPNPNLPEPGLDTLAYIAKQAKQWIDLCDTHHDYCRSLRSNLTPSISLIDCNRYCLVRGFEGARYVALSYVWGDTGRAFNLPERRYGLRLDGLPRTISDAIVVTKSLGYDYIWVDMLCIDQQNKEDKHRQIAIMDQVYRSADLTIIVTAGSDCGNGIPGVSKTCRAPRMSTTIGGLTLVEEKEDAIREVELSFWRLRGWTFQEGLLSRRRLVFTNSQMLFSCVCGVVIEPNEGLELSHNCQSIPESMIWPPGEDMLWDRLFLQTESNPRTTLIGNGNKAKHDYGFPISFAELLEKYSTMQFSFESDVVDAFRAISNTFAQRKPPVLHLYGLPFISGDESITSSSLTRGLAWCLKRDNEETARRPGFPSWSWLGYRGPVRWGAMKREGPIFPVDRDLSFHNCLNGGGSGVVGKHLKDWHHQD
ncbi:Heterokaryon incompatibility protein [Fusarium longipes]|uniref:Heterokaryon incompatibility protein n=1 Tax=Fusarium longipes TaxID=694270 RepID=A0A395T940_9HYPO|nr:Heterokaryon incompatibility protein [Fusarium longipes]